MCPCYRFQSEGTRCSYSTLAIASRGQTDIGIEHDAHARRWRTSSSTVEDIRIRILNHGAPPPGPLSVHPEDRSSQRPLYLGISSPSRA